MLYIGGILPTMGLVYIHIFAFLCASSRALQYSYTLFRYTDLDNVIDLLLVYVWYYHLAISVGFSVVRFALVSEQRLGHTFYEFLVIVVTTLIFAFVEKTMKEDWVLFDSFKRAQKIYAKLIDQTPIPTFVTDSAGRILYCNLLGKELYGVTKSEAINKVWNFLELVYADHKSIVEEMMKRVGKEEVEAVEVPLFNELGKREVEEVKEAPKPPERAPSKVQLGLDTVIVNRGKRRTIFIVGYKYFKIKMERVAWKASNCVMLSCEYIMNYKESYDTLLRNGMRLRTQLKQMCGT